MSYWEDRKIAGWARSSKGVKWHGFTEEDAALCSITVQHTDVLLPHPITQGVEDICRSCVYHSGEIKKLQHRRKTDMGFRG